MCKWTQEYEEYILLRGFELISFLGQDLNWFLYPMHFFAFFLIFYEKMLQIFINDFISVPKSILQKFFVNKLFYSHPRDTFYNILRQFMHFYNCCQIICSRGSYQNLNIYFFSCVHRKIHRSFLKFCNSVNMIDIDMNICRILF